MAAARIGGPLGQLLQRNGGRTNPLKCAVADIPGLPQEV
jgi:hypothetical protein